MKTAYWDLREQYPHPVPTMIPYTPMGSKHKPVPRMMGMILPRTLLLAQNKGKATQTTIIHHGAKWRITKHHMTPQDLPAITHD